MKMLVPEGRARAALPSTTARTFRFRAGDQGAESVFAVVKRNMRRLNLDHAYAGASRINFLSSAWLSKHPAFADVGRAMKYYQDKVLDTVAPSDVYKHINWVDGLEPLVQ